MNLDDLVYHGIITILSSWLSYYDMPLPYRILAMDGEMQGMKKIALTRLIDIRSVPCIPAVNLVQRYRSWTCCKSRPKRNHQVKRVLENKGLQLISRSADYTGSLAFFRLKKNCPPPLTKYFLALNKSFRLPNFPLFSILRL